MTEEQRQQILNERRLKRQGMSTVANSQYSIPDINQAKNDVAEGKGVFSNVSYVSELPEDYYTRSNINNVETKPKKTAGEVISNIEKVTGAVPRGVLWAMGVLANTAKSVIGISGGVVAEALTDAVAGITGGKEALGQVAGKSIKKGLEYAKNPWVGKGEQLSEDIAQTYLNDRGIEKQSDLTAADVVALAGIKASQIAGELAIMSGMTNAGNNLAKWKKVAEQRGTLVNENALPGGTSFKKQSFDITNKNGTVRVTGTYNPNNGEVVIKGYQERFGLLPTNKVKNQFVDEIKGLYGDTADVVSKGKDLIITPKISDTANLSTTTGDVTAGLSSALNTATGQLGKEALSQASQNVASVILGNKTIGGNLVETPIDKATPKVENILSHMGQDTINGIANSKEPVREFASNFDNNYKKINDEISRVNQEVSDKGITINGGELVDQIKQSDFYKTYEKIIQDDLANNGVISKENQRLKNRIDGILNKYDKVITIDEAENIRKGLNDKYQRLYNDPSKYTAEEVLLDKVIGDNLRQKEYNTIEKYYPEYRTLTSLRSDYTSLVKYLTKDVAREQNQIINGLSGNNLFKSMLRGATDTIDISDVLYAFTNGGLQRTIVEAMIGGFEKGVLRYNRTSNMSQKLRNALKPLTRSGVEIETTQIPQPQFTVGEPMETDRALPMPNINDAKNRVAMGQNVFSTIKSNYQEPMIAPYSYVEPQSTAGEKYAIQEGQKAEIENVTRNKEQFAKEMADNVLYDLQSWLDEPTTNGALNDIGDRWTKQFYKDYYGEDVKILQQDDDFEALRDRIEELSEQLEEYGDIDKVLEEKAKEDERLAELNERNNKPNEDIKQKQLEIILKNNPMVDDYHTGIRRLNDIKTFEETINDEESFVYGDFTKDDAIKALENGEVVIYSSKPIKQGGFVSTSKNMAKDYSGNGKIYSKKVKLDDVAWINGDEGQYANTKTE